jgi:hypothetical protein
MVMVLPRRAQGIESILVASMCRYRTIILRGASRLRTERDGGGVGGSESGKVLSLPVLVPVPPSSET